MNCNDSHEHLALRLYAELDERDGEALQAHLDGCAACRTYAAQLQQGLGRLSADATDDLPQGWAAQLSERVGSADVRRSRESRPAASLIAGVSIAAGFLLGLVCTSLLTPVQPGSGPSDPGPRTELAPEATLAAGNASHSEFRRATAPPLATTVGDLGRLRSYLGR